jgi:hypothetical protein
MHLYRLSLSILRAKYFEKNKENKNNPKLRDKIKFL